MKLSMSLSEVNTAEESKEDKTFYKALFLVIVVVFTLILVKSNLFTILVKQLKHKEMNKEKYIWVSAGEYFTKTEITLNNSLWVKLELKKEIPLPCIIVLNFTEVKYYRQYGITDIELVFDKTWKGKIETSEGTKEVEFTGVIYTTFSGRTTARCGNYYLEPRGLSVDGVVVLDLTKEKVKDAHIIKVILFTSGMYIKLKIVKIGFPKQ